jgi:penicillin amidase
MGGTYEEYRGFMIKRRLGSMRNITISDMQHLQTDIYNVFAEMAKPVLLKYMAAASLNSDEQKFLNSFKNWNLQNDSNEEGPSIFTTWWDSLMGVMYSDDFARSTLPLPGVEHSTLLESLLKDSAYVFSDDITTPEKETTGDMVLKAFRLTIPQLKDAEQKNTLAWGKFKNGAVRHLLKIPALSRYNLVTGGGEHIINATKQFHGPSWRMIVELTDDAQAYGIYPGGQSGNPGSKYYASFIDDWALGKYYKIAIVKKQDLQKKENAKITFKKS